MLRNAMGVGVYGSAHISVTKSNVISVTTGWGVEFPEKKHYVTLEWPSTVQLMENMLILSTKS